MVRPCSCPASDESGKGLQRQGARHVQNLNSTVAVIGIDIGKNSFHVVGLDDRGAIVLRQKCSRGQVEARLANMPPCLIGTEASTWSDRGLSVNELARALISMTARSTMLQSEV
jgi:hypothetical protein